jgi:hypothetical protein
MALDYGLSVELIQDDRPNFLYYSKDKLMNGAFLFKNYVEELYKLKSESQMAKLLLNILSGAISEKQITKFYVDEKLDNFIDLDDLNLKLLKSSVSIDRTKSIYKCVNSDRFYCSQFARFKPFMLAHARLTMLKIILPINHLVKKVYIDSIISTEPLEFEEGWGKLKMEYSNKHIKILNNRKELILN